MILEDYLNLIPSANRDKPAFIGTLSAWLEVLVYIQGLSASMVPLFDVDNAVGAQLDIVGQWVGVSRKVTIPVTGVYFSWNDVASVGWNFGSWASSGSPTQVTVLPDDTYRVLIKFKIAANRWDGTANGAYAIWEVLFPGLVFLVQDNQDMTYNLAILGGTLDSLTLALIRGGAIALKPEGVRIANYFIQSSGPAFAFDVENVNLKGWDEGSWATQLSPL